MAPRDPLDAFTPRERAAWDVYARLGDAARRALHASEVVARAQVTAAAKRARALAARLRTI